MLTPTMNNEIIEKMPVLRTWHSFNAEKLQNIDGKGNDLLPLPNIKNLIIEKEVVNLPYLDILLEESKIAPQILLYSGNLSPMQKQLFEDLHKKAEVMGGKVFPLNYTEVKDKLSYSNFLDFDRMLKLSSVLSSKNFFVIDEVEFKKLAISKAKADFIDLQRLVILYDMNNVFDFLEKKYSIKFSSQEILYADFDREIQAVVNHLSSNEVVKKATNGVLLPFEYTPHALKFSGEGWAENLPHSPSHRDEEISRVISQKYLGISLENNFIYCNKNNSPLIREVIEKARNNLEVFNVMSCILLQPIKKFGEQKGINIQDEEGIKFLFKNLSESEVADFYDKVVNEINKIGVLNFNLEGTKDVSWQKDLNTLMIEEYNKSKEPATIAELTSIEEPKIGKPLRDL